MEEKIKSLIKGKSYEQLPSEAYISPIIQDMVLQAKKNNLSFNALKIVLLLCANLKDQQIKKSQKHQLDLFDNEWFEIDNNTPYTVQLAFRFSDFLPKGNKNYGPVKDGIDELQQYNEIQEFSKVDPHTGKVRNFKLKSAFISSYLVEEGHGFKITINNYWYRALINLTERFNPFIKNLVFNLNPNAVIFYFYLKSLPIINTLEYKDLVDKIGSTAKRITGTIIKIENFLKIFNSNLKYESKIKEKILDPIRNELNTYADISFNYQFESGKIKIVTYEISSLPKIEKNSDVDTGKIREAINYKVKKYKLSRVDAQLLIEVYLKYTYDIVLVATNKKRILRDLTGETYVTVLNTLVEQYAEQNKAKVDKNAYGDDQRKKMRDKLRNSFKNLKVEL